LSTLSARPIANSFTLSSGNRLIEDGKALSGRDDPILEDPMAFVHPWKVTKAFGPKVTAQPQGGDVTGTYNEEIRCMDGEMVNPLKSSFTPTKLEPLPTAKWGPIF